MYLAEQDSGAGFRRKVAIKLLNSNVARSPEAGRRMRDEARILGLLSHRNIVTVLDLVRLGERWAVIMDFVPGADLEQVLDALQVEEAAFPLPAALEVGAAVCAALDAAWVALDGTGAPMRVVHRDIKPSNVRLSVDGDVKVLDFGVARVQLESRESSTRGSAWLGTERYMSPERILCESDDAPGDVYAVAATVVELLLGRPLGRTPVLEERHRPFVDEALATIAQGADDDPDLVEALIAQLREALDASPARRPSARQLADNLRSLARRARGESLVEFSRRFVPRVSDVLGRHPRPASGILSEATGGASGEPSQSAPTLMPDDAAGEAVAAPRPEQASGRHRWLIAVGGLLGLGGVTMLALAGLALTGVLGARRATSAPDPVPMSAPVPVPEPLPEPAPEPEPVPEATPEPVTAPEPLTAPEPVAAPVPPPRPAPVPAPAPVVSGPRVDRAQVSLSDASGIQVTCGDVMASGTASVRLRDFPAGPCAVSATWLGASYSTTVEIAGRREVRCVVDGGVLTCR